MWIRWLLAGGLIVGLIALTFWSLPEPSKRLEKGDHAVAISLPDLEGRMHGLPDGGLTLLHFWATWCAPCRSEMPALVKLYEDMREEGLHVLAVSTDRGDAEVRDFVQQYRMRFPVLRDPSMRVANRYGITGYPETYIIDRQGVILAHIVGPGPWESEQTRRQLRAWLQTPAERSAHSTADVKQPGG